MDNSVLDVRSVWIDIFFLACLFAVAFGLAGRACDLLFYKKKPGLLIGIGSGMVLTYPLNEAMKNLPDCVKRLDDILSSASYVLSFDANRKIFFSALNIRNTDANVSKLPEILYYMNQSEWNTVIENGGDMTWYLKRIWQSLNKTDMFYCFHLGKRVSIQGVPALFPMAICLLFVLLLVFRYKRYVTAVLFLIFLVTGYRWMLFGTMLYWMFFMGAFLCIYICDYSRLCFWKRNGKL